MAVSEDVWDQISRLNKFKDGRHIQDKIKNSLRSFTYSFIDLDLREFYTDRKKIRTLTELSKDLSILKPDKGNGIVVMKRSDYLSSVTSLFSDASRFKLLDTDPTPTRLNSLHHSYALFYNVVKFLNLTMTSLDLKQHTSVEHMGFPKFTNITTTCHRSDLLLTQLEHHIITLENFSLSY